MSTKSYREAKKLNNKKDHKNFLEHYIEEVIRKAIDESIKGLFKEFK